MSQRNRCLWIGKNPNHSGGIITPVASVYRLLWPKKLFHTFSVELASSECFMLLLFNHNNKTNSDDSSNKIQEVLEKKKAQHPPRDKRFSKTGILRSVRAIHFNLVVPVGMWVLFIGLLRFSPPTWNRRGTLFQRLTDGLWLWFHWCHFGAKQHDFLHTLSYFSFFDWFQQVQNLRIF